MHYTVQPSVDGTFVIVKVVGEVTTALAREYSAVATEKSREWNIRNFMIDAREARNVESTLTNYEYAYEDMPKQDLNAAARVALLVAPEDHSHDFIEVVTRNAGFNVRLFRNEAQARNWINKTEPVNEK